MKQILVDIPTEILTPRLLLRPLQPGDGKNINDGIKESLEELKIYMPWAQEVPPLEASEEVARSSAAKWLMRDDLTMAMFERATGDYLGGTGLHRINWNARTFEIGYWLRSTKSGRGYVTESANALTQLCFKHLKANRVDIRCDTRNTKSTAIAERLGFEKEGVLRNYQMSADGKFPIDMVIYARINMDGLPSLEVKW